ncbi:hypothetical protein CAPTEDRAFT_158288 [Capitella teleta]|uniref:Peptidase M12B domain-containing protein n=1 Tax=Capitella teleta TaxID=283909 RepID=R7UQU8_CAPTE|nr:hypothetical protein CAPTEDRAFT_158288 [Capitella teleta]|eukprot:ELU06312.1 hypothetical protein CAPTEDRAFT_158288 [Capitella teleta]
MLLEVQPDTSFIGGELVVEHQGANQSWVEADEVDKGMHCFYSGGLRGVSEAAVTISVCGHMMGTIRTAEDHFMVEPHLAPELESSLENVTDPFAQPHVIYRLQHLPHFASNNLPCGVKATRRSLKLAERYDFIRWLREKKCLRVIQVTLVLSLRASIECFADYGTHLNSSIPHHRSRRSISAERHVEVLLVADYHMKKYHQHQDLRHYLLTLMSIVASIYKDASIGNYINIVVVRMIILESPEVGFPVSANAASTLRHFCHWQHRQNEESDSNPYHHDTAVLVTRMDLCRSTAKCDTLGLAELGTMCDQPRSCSINEDSGLSAAFTIAHELGHVFSLPHDDNKVQCAAFAAQLRNEHHIMAPTLDHATRVWSWSPCSRNKITEFIDAGFGECLLDAPTSTKYIMKAKYPRQAGEVYNANKQCALVFGEESEQCPYMPVCRRLWCTSGMKGSNEGCRTQHMPWADGTPCMPYKWCQRGRCVPKQELRIVDGGWGRWSKYGNCSRPCGGGIKRAQRICDNPVPLNSGRYCTGKRVKFKSCNIQNCPENSEDFRAAQCAKYNGKHFNILGLDSTVEWEPMYIGIHDADRCKLYCKVTTSRAYYKLSEKVIDGTKCGPDTSDMCVNGKCMKAGCNNVLGADIERDDCGVCGGDNTNCHPESGSFQQPVVYGYNFVKQIPKGATNLLIRQTSRYGVKQDDTYLALMDSRREYILNGNFVVSLFRKEVRVKGSILEYSGSDTVDETIAGSKMLMEDLYLQVLSVGKLHPPNITYYYRIASDQKQDSRAEIRFEWSTKGKWGSECSRHCNGTNQREIICIRSDNGDHVDDKRCAGDQKPAQHITRPCNTQCTLRWRIVEQSACSERCGVGHLERRIRCLKQSLSGNSYVEDSQCEEVSKKPPEIYACRGLCLPTKWKYTEWSKCSRTCGGGVQYRDAKCVDHNDEELESTECRPEHRQALAQMCQTHDCPEWLEGEWGKCSVTCENGWKQRQIWCKYKEKAVSKTMCDADAEPATSTQCVEGPCPLWYTGNWGQCSSSCGDGYKRRNVKCRHDNGNILDDERCSPDNQPEHTVLIESASQIRHHVITRWRTGSWTECSATCGQGTRERYVSCRDKEGNIAKEHSCAHLPRPASIETCVLRSCSQWRTGEWTSCSVTCGEGVATRLVACISLEELEEQRAQPTQCDVELQPPREKLCNVQACVREEDYAILSISSNSVVGSSHWRAGPWGGCSVTCGTGWQRRRVICQDETGVSHNCDPAGKPPDFRTCRKGPCPRWQFGDWGQCSVTCGGGIQHRMVICQMPNGQMKPDHFCDIRERPPISRECQKTSCHPGKHKETYWDKSSWTSCSVTCGRGRKSRQVWCVDQKGTKLPDALCPLSKRPRVSKRCKHGRCPRWATSSWSKCSRTCGPGLRHRKARCVIHRNRSTGDDLCEQLPRPNQTEPCELRECGGFFWKASKWTECSSTCGTGQTHRKVLCIDSQSGSSVAESHCDGDDKPRSKRKCQQKPCPLRWVAHDWSHCSISCEEGRQVRRVHCRAVSKEGLLMPGNLPWTNCNATERPETVRVCNNGGCNDTYQWTASNWSECSKSCGEGKKTRELLCVDKAGAAHERSKCSIQYKPDRVRPAYSLLAVGKADDCRELRKIASIREDGEYQLHLQGKPVKIFCSGMSTSRPREYITLASQENFSEIYDKRLVKPTTCPANGTRVPFCRNCFTYDYQKAGKTSFQKIRLNMTDLTVITNDYKFSTAQGGHSIPFATAGDCYSSSQVCPQGHFKVDLSDTGFKVSSESKWAITGHRAVQNISISEGGEIVRGKCGGWCGLCSPKTANLLQVSLDV